MKYNYLLYKLAKEFAVDDKKILLKEQEEKLFNLINTLMKNKVKYYDHISEAIKLTVINPEDENYLLLDSIYQNENDFYFYTNYAIKISKNEEKGIYYMYFNYKEYFESLKESLLINEEDIDKNVKAKKLQ